MCFGRGLHVSVRSRDVVFSPSSPDVYVRVTSKVVDGWRCNACGMPTIAIDVGVAWLPRTTWTSSRERKKRSDWKPRRIPRRTGACARLAVAVRCQPIRQGRARRNESVWKDDLRRSHAPPFHATKTSKIAGEPPVVAYVLTDCSFRLTCDDAHGLVSRRDGQRPHLLEIAVCFCKFGRW